jgi:hypothetical protein
MTTLGARLTKPMNTKAMARYSLSGLGAAAPQADAKFVAQWNDGKIAVGQLGSLAKTISLATTDPAIKNAADIALTFVNTRANRLLDEALANVDIAKMIRVQSATKNIVAALKPEIVPALLNRWLLMTLVGPIGLAVPASAINKAKEEGIELSQDLGIPPGVADAEKMKKILIAAAAGVGGLAVLVSLGYVARSFKMLAG